jgi:L-ascorbate metabolism protein UlaG (beta-lactamase superfamily)
MSAPDDNPHALYLPAADAFRARVRELDRAHRERLSLTRSLQHATFSSWLFRWLRGLLAAPHPALPPSEPIPLPGTGECVVTFIGHATTLLRYAEARVLTDPCFARSLYSLKRVRAAGLPPGALEGLDLVLLSHAHADHLHRPSLERLDRAVTLIVPPGCSQADGLGFQRVVELEPGASFKTRAGLEVIAVPAQHRVGLFGRQRALGYVIRGDGPTIYFAGDTGYFSGFIDVGLRFRPDVAILPISGYRPRALRADHLSPLDALYAFEDLGAHLMLPIHHSTFALGYEPVSEPLLWLRSLAGARGILDKVAWLEPGSSCVARRAYASLPVDS